VSREIVLVSGAPGSGKSTLAHRLSVLTGISLLSKDVIKEALWDALAPTAGDLDWSRRLGGAAMEVLWALAAFSPRVILEANFRPHSEYERAKMVELSDRIVEVYCWCPPDVASERYARRAAEPTHHPAHVTPQLDPLLLAEFDQPIGLGTLIQVETTRPVDADVVAKTVLAALDQFSLEPGGEG
jgi:predicted kinase